MLRVRRSTSTPVSVCRTDVLYLSTINGIVFFSIHFALLFFVLFLELSSNLATTGC